MRFEKMTVSLRSIFILVILVALSVSIYLWFARDLNSLDQRRRAEAWMASIRRDRIESISLELSGQSFAISNSVAYKVSEDRWIVGTSDVLKDEIFAYPPGKRVKDVKEAFLVFEEYLQSKR